MSSDWNWPRGKPTIMGVLNLTPDSFYDGGQYQHVDHVLERVQSMVDDGVDLLDIGGESSRPGADPVSIEEEKQRVLPIIDALVHHYPHLILSIDTVKAPLAYEAVKNQSQKYSCNVRQGSYIIALKRLEKLFQLKKSFN